MSSERGETYEGGRIFQYAHIHPLHKGRGRQALSAGQLYMDGRSCRGMPIWSLGYDMV